jgi:hypothetical protein
VTGVLLDVRVPRALRPLEQEPRKEIDARPPGNRLTRPKNHEAAKLRAELERYRSLLVFNTNPRTARVFRELIAQVEARLEELRRALGEAKP